MLIFKSTRQFKIIAAYVMVSLAISVFYQNCGVRKPSVEMMEYASVGYTHTGQETSCSSCHEVARPTSTNGFIGLNVNAPFDYANHGLGFDCFTCHSNITKSSRTRADWAGGLFKHAATLTSCASCHNPQRPTTAVNGFDHKTSGAGDCFACHQASFTTSFASLSDWSGGMGVPASLVWDSTRDVSLMTYQPLYSGTTMTSPVSTSTQTLHMAMNHNSSQISSANLKNCALCHSSANQGIYSSGLLHTSLSMAGIAQPKNCNECHNGAVPTGFVGSVDTSRNPQTPAMKHNAVAWVKNASGVYAPSTSAIVTNDCMLCHTSPSATTAKWSGGDYHVALTNAGVNQPSSCLDCHANSRPSGVVPAVAVSGVSSYNHSNSGMGDCLSCHSSTSSWSNGKYHTASTGAVTSCNTCHASERPSSTTTAFGTAFLAYDATNKPFDVNTHGGAMDCASCHANPGSSAVLGNWSGANFVHSASLTSCASCHSSQRPTTVVSGFNHSTDGTGDCISCHQQSITNNVYTSMANWSGGVGVPATINLAAVMDSGKTVAPAITISHPTVKTGMSCTTCHGSNIASGNLIGYDHNDKINSGSTLSCYYCHATGQSVVNATGAKANTAWASPSSITIKGINNPSAHTSSTYVAQGTCVGCHHTNNGPVWTTNTNKFINGSNF